MNALPDGEYDVFVIDVEEIPGEGARIEVTVTSGDKKGDVIAVRAEHARDDAMHMLGLPGTLIVRDGLPRLELET